MQVLFYIQELQKCDKKGSEKVINANTILKAKMVENGMTQEQLSQRLGIDRSTLNRKLKNIDSFTVGEAKLLRNVLNLSSNEAVDIFFSQNVA